ncbi:MAG: YggT family protein [Gammaproteobacteria bacterium]
MGNSYFTDPLDFLIQTLVGLYVMVIMLRVLLQWARADFYNPISQFIVKATNPPLVPMRRLIPGFGGVDVAAIVLMLIIEMAALAFLTIIHGGVPDVLSILVMSVAELLKLLINVFFFSIIIQAILSWVNPHPYHPGVVLLQSLNEPLLRPARRVFPPISGMDLSPLIVLIALQVLKMLLLPPILALA